MCLVARPVSREMEEGGGLGRGKRERSGARLAENRERAGIHVRNGDALCSVLARRRCNELATRSFLASPNATAFPLGRDRFRSPTFPSHPLNLASSREK